MFVACVDRTPTSGLVVPVLAEPCPVPSSLRDEPPSAAYTRLVLRTSGRRGYAKSILTKQFGRAFATSSGDFASASEIERTRRRAELTLERERTQRDGVALAREARLAERRLDPPRQDRRPGRPSSANRRIAASSKRRGYTSEFTC